MMNINDLDTPSVVIDLDQVERNLKEMQAKAGKFGVALRPHIKAHKIPELARMQLELGARGITAAKVGEAEVMAEAGVDDIFIANQVIGPAKLNRAANLAERVKLSIGLDSRAGAEAASRIMADRGLNLDCLIEVNSGLNRCGLTPGRELIDLARLITDLPGLNFKGIFTHAGQAYGQSDRAGVERISELESRLMVQAAEDLAQAGLKPAVVSVGSTPTMKVWTGCPGVTEIRPGAYIFNDAVQVSLGAAEVKDCALIVLTTVISRPAPDRAVVDAGAKTLALDKGAHGAEGVVGHGLIPGRKLIIDRLSEEHGVLAVDQAESLAVGDRLAIIPNHSCPVINLVDRVYTARSGRVSGTMDVAARGRTA